MPIRRAGHALGLVALLLATTALVAGCHQEAAPELTNGPAPASGSATPSGALRLPPNLSGFGSGFAHTPLGRPIAFNTIPLCSVGGPARITDIEPNHADGLTLVDWGVRPLPQAEDRGMWKGGVLDDPTFTQLPVSTPCAAKSLTELDISAQRSIPVGTLHGFYIVSGHTKLFVPMSVALCAKICPDGAVDTP